MDLRYILNSHYSLSANVGYQTLKKGVTNDGLEDGFNTPEWISTASVNGINIYKSFGFGVTLKYQSNYYWQSFLINGNVPAFFNTDFMITGVGELNTFNLW